MGLDCAEDPQRGGVGMLLLGGDEDLECGREPAKCWRSRDTRTAPTGRAAVRPSPCRLAWPWVCSMAESGAGIRSRKRKGMERKAGPLLEETPLK